MPVVIISANRETLDDLEGYLRGVGVGSVCSRHLGVAEELGLDVLALVVFPDDFLPQNVLAMLSAIGDCRPSILAVLATSEPRRYEPGLADNDRVVIMPRPVWAWTIFDVIRSHLAAHAPTQVRRRRR
jgi:hypothetical protein